MGLFNLSRFQVGCVRYLPRKGPPPPPPNKQGSASPLFTLSDDRSIFRVREQSSERILTSIHHAGTKGKQ